MSKNEQENFIGYIKGEHKNVNVIYNISNSKNKGTLFDAIEVCKIFKAVTKNARQYITADNLQQIFESHINTMNLCLS